jgi:leucyl-tRNA synthetase
MDAQNDVNFASSEAINYWQDVDLYMGGAEHATGHLLYARFWHKFFADRNWTGTEEPFKKLINQGMIQGTSAFVYRINGSNTFVSKGLKSAHESTAIHVDINFVDNNELDTEAFKNWRSEFADAEFILEDGKYICGAEVEKMSKSKFNVVTPDSIIEKYGADTLRMYEMFLGPLEQSKPWNTNGISGVYNFIKKLWRLYNIGENGAELSTERPSKESLKTLHKTIKKVAEDVEAFSFNTTVSTFMICVNELMEQKCNHKAILEPLAILVSPYAPHLAEELWAQLGNNETIVYVDFPEFDEHHLVENSHAYPVSFNGKMRFKMELSLSLSPKEVEDIVLASEQAQKYLEGNSPKKVIVVPKKIVNVVL